MMANRIGESVKTYRDVIIRNSQIGDYSTLADDVFITDSVLEKRNTIERRGMIFSSRIGKYSYTGYNAVVKHAEIGCYCSISWNVSIGGANHDFSRLTTHPFPIVDKYGFVQGGGGYSSFSDPLVIGNDVWIGSGVAVTRDTTIGDGAVIGANSIVTHDVPPYEIWAGNPARKIGQRFSDEIIAELLRLKWWDMLEAFLKDHISIFQRDSITTDLLHDFAESYQVYLLSADKETKI